MKRLFVCFCVSFVSVFSIVMDNLENIDFHNEMAYEKPFSSVGLIIAEPNPGSGSILGTGTLIHPRAVLTAAHVLKNTKNAKFFLVTYGKVEERKGKVICHPGFTGKDLPGIAYDEVPSDLALFILDEPITDISYPALGQSKPPILKDYYATGYGGTNAPVIDEEEGVDKFTVLSVPDSFYKGIIGIPCDNRYNLKYFGSVRSGDSGGPLILRNGNEDVIYGVTSCILLEENSSEEAEEKDENHLDEPFYACYASVHTHIDWIIETIAKNL